MDPTLDQDQLAYDATSAERAAMDPKHVPPYTLDAMYASGKALMIARTAEPFRDRMIGLGSEFDVAHFDRLETYARALLHVHTEVVRHVQHPNELPTLAAEGYELRALLLGYAQTLSRKGTVAPALVARVRRGTGYLDLVEDLFVLAVELRSLPETLVGPDRVVTPQDLSRATSVAHQISLRLGARRRRGRGPSKLLDERRLLGALLLRAHGQVWRVMSFLRFDQGDVDRLVPSLYVPRKGRGALRS